MFGRGPMNETRLITASSRIGSEDRFDTKTLDITYPAETGAQAMEGALDRLCDRAEALEVRVGQDRLAHLEALLARGALEIEDVRPRPDEHLEGTSRKKRLEVRQPILTNADLEKIRCIGHFEDRSESTMML
jgi:hypothetical protein